MTKQDLINLRQVLRYISTSDITIQNEVLRLDAVLEKALHTINAKEKHRGHLN